MSPQLKFRRLLDACIPTEEVPHHEPFDEGTVLSPKPEAVIEALHAITKEDVAQFEGFPIEGLEGTKATIVSILAPSLNCYDFKLPDVALGAIFTHLKEIVPQVEDWFQQHPAVALINGKITDLGTGFSLTDCLNESAVHGDVARALPPTFYAELFRKRQEFFPKDDLFFDGPCTPELITQRHTFGHEPTQETWHGWLKLWNDWASGKNPPEGTNYHDINSTLGLGPRLDYLLDELGSTEAVLEATSALIHKIGSRVAWPSETDPLINTMMASATIDKNRDGYVPHIHPALIILAQANPTCPSSKEVLDAETAHFKIREDVLNEYLAKQYPTLAHRTD